MKNLSIVLTCNALILCAVLLLVPSCSDDSGGRSSSPNCEPSSWPNECNRGIPAGTVLTDYGTPGQMLTVTENGAVFEDLNILSSGEYFDINVCANNVTFRRCRYGSMVVEWGLNTSGYTGLLVEDCESTGGGCGPSEYTIRRCYIHGALDGPRIGGFNIVIEDNYIYTSGGNHIDCIQSVGTSGSVIIRGNTLENSGEATACINVSGTDFLIENNLIAGGGFSIYTAADITTMRIVNNRFSTKYYPHCGLYGILYNPWNASGAENLWEGNVWHESGLACPPDNP